MDEDRNDSDIPWFEKDWDDTDLNWVPQVTALACSKWRTTEPSTGLVYPQDVWFILSNYIHPESVATFACLCCGSHQVVHTASFWRNIYKRFYTPSKANRTNLPSDLKLGCLDTRYGLQARVVKALHYLYEPLRCRLKDYAPFQFEVDRLTNKDFRCTVTWHCMRNTNKWQYYFKLKKDGSRSSCLVYKRKNDTTCDLYANEDSGCYVIQASCVNYIHLPSAMGMKLSQIVMSVSPVSYRYYKLKMVFSIAGDNHEIVIDPITSLVVLPWWHPMYSSMQRSVGRTSHCDAVF